MNEFHRHIMSVLHREGVGRMHKLDTELEKMSVDAQRELYESLRHMEHELDRERSVARRARMLGLC